MDLYSQEIQETKIGLPQTIKKMAIGTYIWIITSNVNGLNAPTRRQTGWMDTKIRPIYMLSTRNPLQTSRHI